MSIKSTNRNQALRAELVALEERIRKKITHLTHTHQKLPYDRLFKGRRLKELCLAAISYLDQGKEQELSACLGQLTEEGIKLESWPGAKS